MIEKLTEEQARQMLKSGRIARLGCIANGKPYVTPIGYRYDDNFIYSHSLPGLKITALRDNPSACVQVDEVESELCWRSVLAFGTFEEIVNPGERALILGRLLKTFPLLTPVESAIAEDGGAPKVVVFRIKIDSITGVYEGAASDKLLLIEDAADGSYVAA
jgi:uncharacterized protein